MTPLMLDPQLGHWDYHKTRFVVRWPEGYLCGSVVRTERGWDATLNGRGSLITARVGQLIYPERSRLEAIRRARAGAFALEQGVLRQRPLTTPEAWLGG